MYTAQITKFFFIRSGYWKPGEVIPAANWRRPPIVKDTTSVVRKQKGCVIS